MTDTGDATSRIYQLKRDLLSLRRAVAPLVEVCNRLMRFDLPHIPEDTRVYFRDVYDHIVRLNETIDAQRELLTTALEAHLSLMSHAQNEHMKRITAWAAMIAVPTMIAGIYGMNFKNMPELGWAVRLPRLDRGDGGSVRRTLRRLQTVRLALAQFPSPNAQFPTTPNCQLPTTLNNFQLWEFLEVGDWE